MVIVQHWVIIFVLEIFLSIGDNKETQPVAYVAYFSNGSQLFQL